MNDLGQTDLILFLALQALTGSLRAHDFVFMCNSIESFTKPLVFFFKESYLRVGLYLKEGIHQTILKCLREYIMHFCQFLRGSQPLIQPIRIKFLGNVIVFVSLKLLQEISKCKDRLSFKGHRFIRELVFTFIAETTLSISTKSFISHCSLPLKSLKYLIEFR